MNTQITSKLVKSIDLTIITLFIMLSAFCLITKGAKADPVEETFEYSGVRELEVEASFFNVQVSGYNGDTVEGLIIVPQNFIEKNYVEVLHSKNGSVLEILVKTKKGRIPPSTEDKIIKIRMPRDIKVDLMTSSGDIEIEDIETDDIRLKSSSGKINFEFKNDFDEFSFDLRPSSGSLNVGESRVKGTFIVGNGPIKITGKSSSGSQEYR